MPVSIHFAVFLESSILNTLKKMGLNPASDLGSYIYNTLLFMQAQLEVILVYEPQHEKTCFMRYANNQGTDQPAHPCSLMSTFVVRCLDSITPLHAVAEISRL